MFPMSFILVHRFPPKHCMRSLCYWRFIFCKLGEENIFSFMKKSCWMKFSSFGSLHFYLSFKLSISKPSIFSIRTYELSFLFNFKAYGDKEHRICLKSSILNVLNSHYDFYLEKIIYK